MSGENLEQGAVENDVMDLIVETPGLKEPTEADLLAMDPEYLEMVEAEKAAGGSEKKEEGDATPPAEDAAADDKTPPDGESGDETPPKKEGDETPAEESKFEDGILPGLTGKQFEALDEPIKEIIAATSEALEKATETATKSQEELKKLLNDPIVLHRKGVIEGKNNTLPYKVPEMKDVTIAEIQKLIDQDTPEGKVKINELLKGHIDSVVEIVANNVRLQEKARYEDEVHTKEAGSKLVALAKLAKIKLPSDDPNVIVNTDLSKLGDIGKVVEEIKSRSQRGLVGNPKKYLAEIDVEELYAQMAIKNKWPLLKNADKIISEQVKASNKKLADRFLKGKPDEASGSFAKGGQLDQQSSASKTVKDGIDLIKLATDDSYHEKILYSKQNDPAWFDRIAVMRDEGERMIEDNPKLNAPRK